MPHFSKKLRKRGFSLVELLVATSILALFFTIAVMDTNHAASTARDGGRRADVATYTTAMSQWYTQYHNFFIYYEKSGTCTLVGTNSYGAVRGDKSDDNCVGYDGGSWGGMTRRKSATNAYHTFSIADALVAAGYLNQVHLDPQSQNFTDTYSTASGYHDYMLTICQSTSAMITQPSNATEYAIFANLENSAPAETYHASQLCAGVNTPQKWPLVVKADTLPLD